MKGIQIALIVAGCAVVCYLVWQRLGKSPSTINLVRELDTASEELRQHSKEFMKPEILKVTDNIYLAIGYAIANSILIEGAESVVIVDVTESYESGREVYEEFRNITKKPISDLIYTHNHADHTYGAKAFVDDPGNPPEIWAHHGMRKEFFRFLSTTSDALYRRAMRQFGVYLPEVINAGIGFRLRAGTAASTPALMYPTKFVNDGETEITLAGIPMKIIHIPGETDDQIGVWIPSVKAFLCADDIYRAFPNLYAIRGTPSRDLLQWVSSLDKIIDLKPEYLVPSHTRPITGAIEIQDTLITYRDAIQYVHDQSVRYINHGFGPNEIAEKVKLPVAIANHPHLKEFYGTTGWSAKAVFSNYLGWFSGDPVDLSPLTFNGKAQRFVKVTGGIEQTVKHAKLALKEQDFQWALELSAYALSVDESNSEAREIKVEALTSLGVRQTSANGRNYYITCAFEEMSEISLKNNPRIRAGIVQALPLEFLFYALSVRFKPEDCKDKNEITYFHFPDTNKNIFIVMRNSIAIVRLGIPKSWDLKVTVAEAKWRDIIANPSAGNFGTLLSMVSGDITVEGGVLNFRSFFNCFERR